VLVEEKLKSKVEGLLGSESKAENTAKMWIGLLEILLKFLGGDVSMADTRAATRNGRALVA
jgi:hypothetical protein